MATTTDEKLVNIAGLKKFKTEYTDTYIGNLTKEVTDANGVNPGESGYITTTSLVTVKEYLDSASLDATSLNTSDIQLASSSNGIVTIKAIKEQNGIISASTDSTKDVLLAKVATSGKAENVSIQDVDNKITATTVEGALSEIMNKLDSGLTDSTVATQISSAISNLDSTQSQTTGTDGLSLSVTETDGKITAISGSIAANTYDAYGAASAIQGSTTETVKSVNDKIIKLNGTVETEGSILKMIKDNTPATYETATNAEIDDLFS